VVRGLEERDGGLWPQFEINVMARTSREAICCSYWHEWEQIRCPVLVVGAGAQESYIEPVTAARMLELKPEMKLVWLEGAKHDLHLDRPAEWREALTAFLDSLGADSG
jgi:pimeloyl-ACP methyl ester carboxylesterase